MIWIYVVYVALSRATCLEGLAIVGFNPSELSSSSFSNPYKH
jgi:hypothetical protein